MNKYLPWNNTEPFASYSPALALSPPLTATTASASSLLSYQTLLTLNNFNQENSVTNPLSLLFTSSSSNSLPDNSFVNSTPNPILQESNLVDSSASLTNLLQSKKALEIFTPNFNPIISSTDITNLKLLQQYNTFNIKTSKKKSINIDKDQTDVCISEASSTDNISILNNLNQKQPFNKSQIIEMNNSEIKNNNENNQNLNQLPNKTKNIDDFLNSVIAFASTSTNVSFVNSLNQAKNETGNKNFKQLKTTEGFCKLNNNQIQDSNFNIDSFNQTSWQQTPSYLNNKDNCINNKINNLTLSILDSEKCFPSCSSLALINSSICSTFAALDNVCLKKNNSNNNLSSSTSKFSLLTNNLPSIAQQYASTIAVSSTPFSSSLSFTSSPSFSAVFNNALTTSVKTTSVTPCSMSHSAQLKSETFEQNIKSCNVNSVTNKNENNQQNIIYTNDNKKLLLSCLPTNTTEISLTSNEPLIKQLFEAPHTVQLNQTCLQFLGNTSNNSQNLSNLNFSSNLNNSLYSTNTASNENINNVNYSTLNLPIYSTETQQKPVQTQNNDSTLLLPNNHSSAFQVFPTNNKDTNNLIFKNDLASLNQKTPQQFLNQFNNMTASSSLGQSTVPFSAFNQLGVTFAMQNQQKQENSDQFQQHQKQQKQQQQQLCSTLAAQLCPELMCFPSVLLNKLNSNIIHSPKASNPTQCKPIPNNERVNLLCFRSKELQKWGADDVVAWMLDVAKEKNIPCENLNMYKFVNTDGMILLSMSEEKFKEYDSTYGSLLYHEFIKLAKDNKVMDDWMGTLKSNNSPQTSVNLSCDIKSNNIVNSLLNQPSFLKTKDYSKTLSPISLQQELSRQSDQQKIQQEKLHQQHQQQQNQQQQQLNFLVAVAAVAAVKSPINTNTVNSNSIDSNSASSLLHNNNQAPQSSALNYTSQHQLNTEVIQQSCDTSNQNLLQQQSQDSSNCENSLALSNFALTSNSDSFLPKDFININKLKDFEIKASCSNESISTQYQQVNFMNNLQYQQQQQEQCQNVQLMLNNCENINNPTFSNNVNQESDSLLTVRRNKDGRPRKRSQHTKGNKLWEFIRDTLKDPKTCPSIVRWEDSIEGVFRIMESEKLAQLWGEKKNNQKMTYEKLSRAMRTYYEKQILVPVPKTGFYPKKLVYKFGPSAHGWSAPPHLVFASSSTNSHSKIRKTNNFH